MNTQTGRGILRCAGCNEPLRDHTIEPCPSLGVDVLRLDNVNRRRTGASMNDRTDEYHPHLPGCCDRAADHPIHLQPVER